MAAKTKTVQISYYGRQTNASLIVYFYQNTDIDACDLHEGMNGVYTQCDDNKAVTSVCTSGRTPDCGSNVYTRIQCCDGLLSIHL